MFPSSSLVSKRVERRTSGVGHWAAAAGRGRCVGSIGPVLAVSDKMVERLGSAPHSRQHVRFQAFKVEAGGVRAQRGVGCDDQADARADGARGWRQLGAARTKDRRRDFI